MKSRPDHVTRSILTITSNTRARDIATTDSEMYVTQPPSPRRVMAHITATPTRFMLTDSDTDSQQWQGPCRALATATGQFFFKIVIELTMSMIV